MISVYSAAKVKELDAKEIELEGITSFQLMQRASKSLYLELERFLQGTSINKIVVLASGGNNGGDALCVADMLCDKYSVVVFYVKVSDRQSEDFKQAYKNLRTKVNVIEVVFPVDITLMRDYISAENVCILDGLLGSGINRVVEKESFLGFLIDYVNSHRDKKKSLLVAIDLPSGLLGEDSQLKNPARSIVKADKTICLLYPKLSTLMPESEEYVGSMSFVDFDMKLMKEGSGDIGKLLELSDIRNLVRPRPKHGHKGTFGKGLLLAGSSDMPGACVLASKSALRSGLGMLYVQTHDNVKPYLMNNLPEAICRTDLATIYSLFSATNAVAVGPGLGTDEYACKLLDFCMTNIVNPMVVDADALNLISKNMEWMGKLPPRTILTPHPAEFQRLFGKCSSRIEMIARQKEMAKAHNVIIVLKGAYTTITDGDELFFNSTGNSGMATAGSGDVLTGIVLALLSQGYEPFDAAKLGVFIHGLAGDVAAEKLSEYSLIASDIIECLPDVFKAVSKI